MIMLKSKRKRFKIGPKFIYDGKTTVDTLIWYDLMCVRGLGLIVGIYPMPEPRNWNHISDKRSFYITADECRCLATGIKTLLLAHYADDNIREGVLASFYEEKPLNTYQLTALVDYFSKCSGCIVEVSL